MPIGNLTSQFFANYYLSAFDHYCKERLRVRRYIRYMDDILVFSSDRDELKSLYDSASCYTGEQLRLRLKPPVYGSVQSGAPFLGFLVKTGGIYLQTKTKDRYRARIKEIEHKRKNGLFTGLEAGLRIESVTSHLLVACSALRNNTPPFNRNNNLGFRLVRPQPNGIGFRR